MGKVDEKKKKKKEALFHTAYELFTTKGVNATSISDIVERAGVAKGTFYLYFKDKYDIKNKLVSHKTHGLFDKAGAALYASGVRGLANQLVFVIDYIINELVVDKPLLHFISKNLVMGAFLTGESTKGDFYERFLELVEQEEYQYEDVEVMLFTVVELAGSAGYNSILYEEPLSIEEYKPFLYRAVHLIVESHRRS